MLLVASGSFSRRSCRKDPDLGSLVGKSAILMQYLALLVPVGHLSVIVGVSVNGRLISESTSLFHGTEIG